MWDWIIDFLIAASAAFLGVFAYFSFAAPAA